jgi:HEPN domain-containing protein
MSQTESRYEAKRWWLTAQDDLEAAKTMHQAGNFSHACFLSQQSAEKAMKALWFNLDSDPWGNQFKNWCFNFHTKISCGISRTGLHKQHIWTNSISQPVTQMGCPT